MKALLIAILLGLAPFLGAHPAFAAGAAACKGDVNRYCGGLKFGTGLGQCLEGHMADLDPGCKQHIKNVEKSAKDVKQACNDDAKRYCTGLRIGYGLARCMESHRSDLSPGCGKKVSQLGKQFKAG